MSAQPDRVKSDMEKSDVEILMDELEWYGEGSLLNAVRHARKRIADAKQARQRSEIQGLEEERHLGL